VERCALATLGTDAAESESDARLEGEWVRTEIWDFVPPEEPAGSAMPAEYAEAQAVARIRHGPRPMAMKPLPWPRPVWCELCEGGR
jgi:hypothetical protein